MAAAVPTLLPQMVLIRYKIYPSCICRESSIHEAFDVYEKELKLKVMSTTPMIILTANLR